MVLEIQNLSKSSDLTLKTTYLFQSLKTTVSSITRPLCGMWWCRLDTFWANKKSDEPPCKQLSKSTKKCKEGRKEKKAHCREIPRCAQLATEETKHLLSTARCPHTCKECLFPATHCTPKKQGQSILLDNIKQWNIWKVTSQHKKIVDEIVLMMRLQVCCSWQLIKKWCPCVGGIPQFDWVAWRGVKEPEVAKKTSTVQLMTDLAERAITCQRGGVAARKTLKDLRLLRQCWTFAHLCVSTELQGRGDECRGKRKAFFAFWWIFLFLGNQRKC